MKIFYKGQKIKSSYKNSEVKSHMAKPMKIIAIYTFDSSTNTLPEFNNGFLNTEIYKGTVYANETINIGVIDPNAKISFFIEGYERPLGSGTAYDNYIKYMPSIGLSLYHYTDGTESKITTNDEPTFTMGTSVQIVIENIAYTDVDNGDGTITRTITSDSSPSSISFNGKTGLLSVDYLDTSNVTNMSGMFRQCEKLESIDLSHFDTSKVESMDGMFMECTNLTSINMTDTDYNSINKIITELPTRTADSYGTLNVTGVDNYNNVNVNTANSKYWNIEKETFKIAEYTFNSSTDTLPTFNSDFTYEYTDVNNGDGTITRTITSDALPTSISFSGKTGLVSLSYLDISNITNMSYMFQNCISLTSIDSSNWDTSNIFYMQYMFCGCASLTTLDLSNWDTSNVTNMQGMFYGCTNLTSLDLSNFDVSNVAFTTWMFYSCKALTSVNISNSNVDSINDIIGYLPARSSNSYGTITVSKDVLNSVDTTSANSKYWNIIN